jgi:hypothetical protein
MPLTSGSGPDPAILVIDLQDTNKNYFLLQFVLLVTFEGTFSSFSKIKSQKSHKIIGIKVYVTIFA